MLVTVHVECTVGWTCS